MFIYSLVRTDVTASQHETGISFTCDVFMSTGYGVDSTGLRYSTVVGSYVRENEPAGSKNAGID